MFAENQNKTLNRLDRIEKSISEEEKSAKRLMISTLEKNEESTKSLQVAFSDITNDHSGIYRFTVHVDNLTRIPMTRFDRTSY